MCLCASERKRECVGVTDRDWMCVCARACVPVCASEKKRERERVTTVKDRERKKERVCVCESQ